MQEQYHTKRTDRRVRRRRGSKRLAVPMALVAIALMAVGLWLAFQEASASSEGSWFQGSDGVVANIPGWPGAGEAPAGTDPLAGGNDPLSASTSPTLQESASSSTTSTTRAITLRPVESPARVSIPSLGVEAELMAVGLDPQGDMEVPPFGRAAWYDLGPLPGAAGPAVIVAHVDSKSGPDVFYHLKDIAVGERIVVTGADGDAATFVVDGKEQQLKTKLPVERIWNQTSLPLLRLITCGGEFDYSTGHYRSNVIVYAHLAEAEDS